jgi:general secretion pathway protein J
LSATSSDNESALIVNQRGFTLLEILIAVLLLGIITAVLYGSYFTVLRARERSSMAMEARRELGSTIDLLRREIASSIYIRGDKRLRFVVEDRDIFGKPASNLELTALAPQSNQFRKESGIINIQYRPVEKEKRLILTRREQDSVIETAEIAAYPQMERISSFLVECYDGSKWVKSWNTDLNMALPTVIRVTVQIEEDGKPVEFSVLSAAKAVGL